MDLYAEEQEDKFLNLIFSFFHSERPGLLLATLCVSEKCVAENFVPGIICVDTFLDTEKSGKKVSTVFHVWHIFYATFICCVGKCVDTC